MAFTVLGYGLSDLKEIAPIVGATVVVGGFVYRGVVSTMNRLLQRDFDHWVVSFTTVSEPDEDGNRWLILDNGDRPETFGLAVRGSDERKGMLHAANKCSWHEDRRFLLMGEDDSSGMLHVTRNSLSGLWKDGAKENLAGRPVDEHVFFFSVTGADAAVGAKKKFRIPVMNPRDLAVVLSHPRDKWRFADESHKTRFATCLKMAEAWRDNGSSTTWQAAAARHPIIAGYMDVEIGGSVETHAILGWIRAYYPRHSAVLT